VTSVDDELFMLLKREVDQVAVYSINDYQLLRHLSVPGFKLSIYSQNDMTSCVRYKCLYMSDNSDKCIHRYDLSGKFSAIRNLTARSHISRWQVPGSPIGLSVTPSCNLLVTCWCVPSKLVELSADSGQCVREITLQSDIVSPWHSVQLTTGEYVVCHGVGVDIFLAECLVGDDGQLTYSYGGQSLCEDLNQVCLVGDDGKVTRSYGGQCGSVVGQLRSPRHLAVDKDSQSIFVADFYNNRVVLLSPTLEFVRYVSEKLSCPYLLYLDQSTRRLFVAQCYGDFVVIQL